MQSGRADGRDSHAASRRHHPLVVGDHLAKIAAQRQGRGDVDGVKRTHVRWSEGAGTVQQIAVEIDQHHATKLAPDSGDPRRRGAGSGAQSLVHSSVAETRQGQERICALRAGVSGSGMTSFRKAEVSR